MNTNNQNPYLIPVAVVVAAIIIAGAVIYGPHGAPSDNLADGPAPTPAKAAPVVDAKDVTIKGDPYIGKSNAPLTVIYWSDYQCPFCKKFDTETLGDVVKNYVNTGKVKVVFEDFQFLGKDSLTMALAGRAVWDLYPDKYFAWREAIYENEGQENSGYATPEFMNTVYKKVPGIDGAKVDALVLKNKAKYQQEIDADKAEGSKFGINGTPGIIAGKMLLSGAVGYASFSAKLDSQLK